jgi:hypothetical protein
MIMPSGRAGRVTASPTISRTIPIRDRGRHVPGSGVATKDGETQGGQEIPVI